MSFEALAAQRSEMAAAFAAQAAMCTARRDTAHPAFHGCVDWHSAAHGAWALAAYENMTGDARYGAQLAANLAPDLIAREAADLRADPSFEMPYGRAWFLRLAMARPNDAALAAMARSVAASLRDYYAKAPPDPRRDRYDNASWALINLLHYARAVRDAELEAFVVGQVRAHFLSPRCTRDMEEQGFIAICVTWAWLVSEALPREDFRAWYTRWNPGLETLQPVRVFPSAHDYGRNFSRAWGLYPLSAALDEPRLRDAYVAHVAAGFSPHTQWRGDYMVNGHWVAQFGMLAIAPLF